MPQIHRLLLLFALLLPNLAHATQPAWPDLSKLGTRTGGGEKDAAVLVAVENYAHVGKVAGAKRNLADWKHWLVDIRGVPAGSIFELTDGDVTKGGIRKKAKAAADFVKQGGTVWFVFIGHGVPAKDANDALMVASDARQSDEVYDYSIGRREVLDTLATGKQARTVFVADSCFSGGKDHGGRDIVRGAQPLIALSDAALRKEEIVFSAGKGNQFAGPLPGEDRPAFTYLLLGGLMGWADGEVDGTFDKRVTVQEASDFARKTLRWQSEREQEPEFAPAGQRETVLGSVVARDKPALQALMRGSTTETVPGRSEAQDAVPKVECPAGSRLESGKCLAAVQCPAGTTLQNGQCLAAVVCPGGAYWDGQRCVGTAAPATPSPPEGMVYLPPGTFTMGSPEGVGDDDERPAHQVTLTRGFYLDRSEVTVAAYAKCVQAGRCKKPESGDWFNWAVRGREQHPVNGVSWHDAVAYCGWVGKRLPTEAEWEYAARSGGREQTYPWGNEEASCARAVMGEDGSGCGKVGTRPVCSKAAGNSAQGVCDLAGNVREWVEDSKGPYSASSATDPRVGSGGDHVNRGGSFGGAGYVGFLRAADRGHGAPDDRFNFVGFRCTRTL